ncbi:unnamed protein product [Urochloa humidicola]
MAKYSPLHKVTDDARWDAEDLFGRLCILAHAAFLYAGFHPSAVQEVTPCRHGLYPAATLCCHLRRRRRSTKTPLLSCCGSTGRGDGAGEAAPTCPCGPTSSRALRLVTSAVTWSTGSGSAAPTSGLSSPAASTTRLE